VTSPSRSCWWRSMSMPRMVFPPPAVMTTVSVRTRPRSWSGVTSSRCRVCDSARVSPVRSATSRRAAAPAWGDDAFTVAGDGQTVRPSGRVMHAKSAFRFGILLTSTLRFSQIRGTFLCPHETHRSKIMKRLRIAWTLPAGGRYWMRRWTGSRAGSCGGSRAGGCGGVRSRVVVRAAGIPTDVEFATKPRLALDMIGAAVDAGLPARWNVRRAGRWPSTLATAIQRRFSGCYAQRCGTPMRPQVTCAASSRTDSDTPTGC
jgi:hypothetical protein